MRRNLVHVENTWYFKRKVKSRKMLINLYIYLVPVMYVAVRESLRCDQFIEGSETQQQRKVKFIAVCTNP